MSSSVQLVPYLIIQSDWQLSLRDQTGSSWVTCKTFGHNGIHGRLKTSGRSSDGNIYVPPSGSFSVQNVSKNHITVKHEDPNCTTTFVAPCAEFSNVHNKSVQCMDITNGGLAVSVCSDNKLLIWDSSSGCIRRQLEGHVGDVYCCRFFPSGLVVLSAGSDFQLRIWSAETGECPVVLKGHSAAIQDAAIIERGKNIISVSKDGTARLWHCGTATCIATLCCLGTTLNCCSIGNFLNSDQLSKPVDEHEIDTENKFLLVGSENGFLKAFAVRSRKQLVEHKFESAVNVCSALSNVLVACGMQDGTIAILDLQENGSVKKQWKYSASPVLSIMAYKEGIFSSHGDGMCIFSSAERDLVVQLTGPDCDPVYKLVCDDDYIYSCCRDGKIRKYSINQYL